METEAETWKSVWETAQEISEYARQDTLRYDRIFTQEAEE